MKLNKVVWTFEREVRQEMLYGQETVRQESQGRPGKCLFSVPHGQDILPRIWEPTMHF